MWTSTIARLTVLCFEPAMAGNLGIHISANCYAELVRNLGEAFHDATGQMRQMLAPGRFLYAYGVFYPDGPQDGLRFDAKHLVFVGRTENEFVFEKPDWWIRQVAQLADFYLDAEFGDGPVDWSRYRTNLSIVGSKTGCRQETDTISRLVYGFASAYLMTGEDRFYEAARSGTKYLRDHLRFKDRREGICYWYHAVDLNADGSETKIFASEFGDDYDAIPCYEQIYALAGPTQTYRIDGDPQILDDAEHTIRLFHRFFRDTSDKGGYLLPYRSRYAEPQRRWAWAKQGPQELELGRRPCSGVSDKPVAGDRRARVRQVSRSTPSTPSPSISPTTIRALSSRKVLRRLVQRSELGLAAEPRRGRTQPEDRLEPDAHGLA